MRVLHVHAGNLYGGVEGLMATLSAERAHAPDLQNDFAFCFDGKIAAQLRTQGTTVHILGPVRMSRPWTALSARAALKHLLRTHAYDAVICHLAWAQGLFGDIHANLPQIFWFHDPPQRAKLHWTERLAARRRPDFVIANSKFTLEFLPKLYRHPPAADVVYCSVSPPTQTYSTEEVAATRAQFGAAPDTPVIIQISRWEKHKGHLAHIETLARLKHLPWVSWFVGGAQRESEKTYLAQVQQLAQSLGIADRVHFLGWQPDVRKLLAAADIYFQPNAHPEPFGITFIEALYAGKPVVTANFGGPAEIITPNCGTLVTLHDIHAFATAIESYLRNPAQWADVKVAGPSRAAHLCDPQRTLTHFSSVLHSL